MMNTFFFVKVRLGRTQGRRSWSFGPFVQFEDATRLLDHVPELILGMGSEPTKYTMTIEERHLQEGQWLKLNTRVRQTVEGDMLVTESG
jgi:hypothetical protein